MPDNHPSAPSLSYLVAFDVERGFIFNSRGPDAERKSQTETRFDSSALAAGYTSRQWEAVFHGCTGWDTRQFPRDDFFAKPLGWMATFTLNQATCPELNGTLTALKEKIGRQISTSCTNLAEAYDVDQIELRASIFPHGIGVMVIQVPLPSDLPLPTQLLDTVPKEIFGERQELIERISERYVECMERSITGRPHSTVRPLTAVNRQRFESEGSIYRLCFFTEESSYSQRVRHLEEANGPCDRDPELCGSAVYFEHSKVYVGWSESLVCLHDSSSRPKIENNFIIALTSWYSLVVMNFLATVYLMEAFVDITQASRKNSLSAISARKYNLYTRRLAYIEVASATHPVRWTMREKDLELMKTIHLSWNSQLWWNNIEERTRSLALHFDQLESLYKDRRDRSFKYLGLGIALFSISSTMAGLIQLYYGNRTGLMLSLLWTLVISLIALLLINWLSRVRSAPWATGKSYSVPRRR